LVGGILDALDEFDEGKKGYKVIMLASSEAFKVNVKMKLLVSAIWLDNKSLKETLDTFVKILKKKLKNKISLISTIHFIKSNDPLIQGITNSFKVEKGSLVDLCNVNIDGLHVENGIILQAN